MSATIEEQEKLISVRISFNEIPQTHNITVNFRDTKKEKYFARNMGGM